jgi:PAS domain S-box-containing protein
MKEDGDTSTKTGGNIPVSERKNQDNSYNPQSEGGGYHHSILMNLGEGIIVIDGEGRIVFSNPRAMEILHKVDEEIQGSYFPGFFSEGSRMILEGELKRGGLKKLENLKLDIGGMKDGKVRLLATITSWKDEEGKSIGNLIILRDFSEFERSETEIKRQVDRFRKILNTIQAGIVQVSVGTGTIEDMNPMASDLIGLPENILKGRDIAEFITVEGEDPVFTRSRRRSMMREGVLKRNDGTPLSVMTSSIRTDLGAKESVVISFMDISDQSRSKATLEKMNDLLRLINKILRHDMLNNLMIVTMGIEHYFDYGEDKLLKNSMLATNRSLELIRSMKELEFFLTDGGALREYSIEKVALSIANNHPIEIVVNGKAMVMADEALSSLLENLVSNAIKHGKADKVWITIKAGDEIVIDVADNGIGISDDLKPKVFKEGFTTSKKRGSGIGLFIVERTVDRYGGRIDVLDNDPEGTIIRIVLPAIK